MGAVTTNIITNSNNILKTTIRQHIAAPGHIVKLQIKHGKDTIHSNAITVIIKPIINPKIKHATITGKAVIIITNGRAEQHNITNNTIPPIRSNAIGQVIIKPHIIHITSAIEKNVSKTNNKKIVMQNRDNIVTIMRDSIGQIQTA